MTNLVYYILCGTAWLISLLPLRALYVLSDGLYFLVYRLVGYRRKVVRKNLSTSFPDKSEKEIEDIEKRFYSWFCDYIVETLKLYSMSEDEIRKRMRFEGVEAVKESCAKGQTCSVYLGHYCNWEWVSTLPLSVDGCGVCAQIYHPLENKGFNKFFLRLRGRTGSVSIPMTETIRHIIKYKNEGKPLIVGFIADQVPHWNNIHYWTTFLNHPDTPVLSGTERIARKINSAVYYMDLRCERRGYYVATFKRLTDTPSELPEFAITEMYYRALEDTINRSPEYWLWTHNRWKRTRERYEERLALIAQGKQP